MNSPPTVGLFIPCFMNEIYPKACEASYELLVSCGYEVDYPLEQTCCGQPVANSGQQKDIKNLARKFVDIFKNYDYIVAPTGSCVCLVKEQYEEFFGDDEDYQKVKNSTYELCEFLHDVVKLDKIEASFPHKVGIHNSCHAHRGLGLASASELNVASYSKIKSLLSLVQDIELVEVARDDECCGFGGTFAVTQSDVSAAMGRDKIASHLRSEVEVMTSVDLSCLMHLNGIIKKEQKPLSVMHFSQILCGHEPSL